MTRWMPRVSATCAACWPAAPPKQHSAKRVTSWPRCTEICLIAFAMRSTAMRTKPAAICSGRGASPRRRGDVARERRERGRSSRRRRAARRRSGRTRAGRTRAEFGRAAGSHRSPSAARRAGSTRVPATRRPTPARPCSRPWPNDRIEPPPAATVWISQHRRADADRRDHGVGRALELAGVQRDVRRRAAHVEADDLVAHRRRARRAPCR